MNPSLHTSQKILQLLGSRFALNCYFWLFLLGLKLSDADDQTAYSPLFYNAMMVFYMLFFALISYVNNFILLPKLLFQKKRLHYFISVFVLLFVVSFVYTFLMKWLPMVIPGFDSMQVSIIMSPVTDDMSFTGVLADIQTYFLIMVVWTIIFTLLGFYHHTSQKVQSMQEALNKHREAELHFLKNQIHPHFLFNTLNNLYALSLKKSDEAPEAILKLSSILRYMLYDADVPLVSFDKEREIMQAYIDIELLRIPDSPHLHFSITADKPYVIPPLIWLPVLENVFKHSRQVDTLEVDFTFSIQQHKLHLYCKNNYTPKPETAAVGGIGLSNLKKRLELLYPQQHQLDILSTENYFIIEVKITLT